MFKNFLVNIFESLLDTRTQVKLFWGSVGGIITIIVTYLLEKFFPNETFNVSIDIWGFSFGWSTYGTPTLFGSAKNFIIGFLLASLLTFMIRKLTPMIRKYLQKKQS